MIFKFKFLNQPLCGWVCWYTCQRGRINRDRGGASPPVCSHSGLTGSLILLLHPHDDAPLNHRAVSRLPHPPKETSLHITVIVEGGYF